MEYGFSAVNHALLLAGKLVQSKTVTGQLLPMLINPETGKIVEIAKAVGGFSAQPLVAATEFVLGAAQMVQTHTGFQETYRRLDIIQAGLQSLQNSVIALQATTALIGLGTVAGVALSAVNLHQTLKLREDIKQLRWEVTGGFIDLRKVLEDKGDAIIEQINRVAQDIKFYHHRTILIQAYGQFLEAQKLIKTALLCKDLSIRNNTFASAQLMLSQALADYNNPHLLEQTCAAGHLRRVECAWAMDQAFAFTYQLLNQSAAVSDRLSHLQEKIRQDILIVTERCESKEELDFIFPEITRITNQDLAVLETWQNQVDWMRSLSSEERKQLSNPDLDNSEIPTSEDSTTLTEPPEQLYYDNLQQKSHFLSLRDQLRFTIKPDLRREYESYIRDRAIASDYKALAPSNWQEIPDFTVANLYWYFKNQEQKKRSHH